MSSIQRFYEIEYLAISVVEWKEAYMSIQTGDQSYKIEIRDGDK